MNYRHAYHAGNFADLVKHAALARLLERLMRDPAPLFVVDTHAGAGSYDLGDERQVRSGEAEAGVARLTGRSLPPEFAGLQRSVAMRNPGGRVTIYPGSPAIVLDALRPQDRLLACELHPDDHTALAAMLARSKKPARARLGDGYVHAVEAARTATSRLLLVIDPPFERPDDYVRTVETLEEVLVARPGACALVWLPLKDLETLDGFVRRLEAAALGPALVAEARLRPLAEPMRMNGCALVALNPPAGFFADLQAICGFVVEALGAPGAAAKVWTPG